MSRIRTNWKIKSRGKMGRKEQDGRFLLGPRFLIVYYRLSYFSFFSVPMFLIWFSACFLDEAYKLCNLVLLKESELHLHQRL